MPLLPTPRKPKKPFTTNRQLFVPSKLADLPALLTTWGFGSRYIDDHRDKFAYVLHKIHKGQLFNIYNTAGGFVSINHNGLAQVLGKRYVKPIISILLEAGVIERDNHFVLGEKSYGFRIATACQGPTIGLFIFNQEVFGWKLEQRAKQKKAEARKDKLLKRIAKDMQEVRINHPAASKHNRTIYESTIAFIKYHADVLDTNKLVKEKYRELLDLASVCGKVRLPSLRVLRKSMKSQEGCSAMQMLTATTQKAYDANRISINKIAAQDFSPPKRPIAGSRVYTNLTNLSSDLRQFLYHAAHPEAPLYNIDIKNSQPFLLSVLLRKKYLDDMLEDAIRYIQETASGVFYEQVATLLGTPLRSLCDTDPALVKAQKLRERKEFKQAFFSTVFFCKNQHTESSKTWAIFQECYPTVAAFIHEAKREDYCASANQMQYVEAQIILEKVVRSLHKQKIWCASIHDSIVCLESHKEIVKQSMLAAFQAEFNLSPSLNEEPLIK